MTEKTAVEEAIAREEQAARERASDRQEVTFLNVNPKEQVNMRIDRFNGFMLDRLAEQYDHTRASMAAALLTAALKDAWKAAGLGSPLEEGSDMKAALLEYITELDNK